MASSKLIATKLRRTPFSLLRPFLLSLSSSPPPPTTSTTSYRHFSSSPSSEPPDSTLTHNLNSVTESELTKLGFIDGSRVSDVVGTVLDDSIFPIRGVVSFLDGFHHFTGLPWFPDIVSTILDDSIFPICGVVSFLDGFHHFTLPPWWIVIASSTVAMRMTLFPWVVFQLHKLKHISEIFPKLPPPFPPLFSGKSLTKQLSLFWRERRASGCPSFLWFAAPWVVQLPCFLLCMTSVRRMSLDQYPGFDTGGTLWFQNLTEVPTGSFGPIFPVLIAGLHFCNIQIGFRSSFTAEGGGLLQTLASWYKKYLELLTLPILFIGFHIPQGSLVYWVTNSSLTLIQQLCLQNPDIRQKLGLLDKAVNKTTDHEKNERGSELLVSDAPRKRGRVSAFDLTPIQLVDLAVNYLSAGRNDRALTLLRLALDKDHECYEAWTILGQIMFQQNKYEEAAEYLEFAISENSSGKPTDVTAIDFHIQASMLAGVAYHRQGKIAESFAHFERLRDLEVPEEPAVKDRYYEGLMLFASVLHKEGHKDEAVKYTRMASDYDPQYRVYLENLEKDSDNFVGDLANSRRADY